MAEILFVGLVLSASLNIVLVMKGNSHKSKLKAAGEANIAKRKQNQKLQSENQTLIASVKSLQSKLYYLEYNNGECEGFNIIKENRLELMEHENAALKNQNAFLLQKISRFEEGILDEHKAANRGNERSIAI